MVHENKSRVEGSRCPLFHFHLVCLTDHHPHHTHSCFTLKSVISIIVVWSDPFYIIIIGIEFIIQVKEGQEERLQPLVCDVMIVKDIPWSSFASTTICFLLHLKTDNTRDAHIPASCHDACNTNSRVKTVFKSFSFSLFLNLFEGSTCSRIIHLMINNLGFQLILLVLISLIIPYILLPLLMCMTWITIRCGLFSHFHYSHHHSLSLHLSSIRLSSDKRLSQLNVT